VRRADTDTTGVLDSGTATDDYGNLAPGACLVNFRPTSAPPGKITVVSFHFPPMSGLVATGLTTVTGIVPSSAAGRARQRIESGASVNTLRWGR